MQINISTKSIRISVIFFVILSLCSWVSYTYARAVGHKDGTSVRFISEYRRHDVRVTSICAEGQIVLVAHSDVGQGGGLQMIQLESTMNGKEELVTCDLNEFAADD